MGRQGGVRGAKRLSPLDWVVGWGGYKGAAGAAYEKFHFEASPLNWLSVV